MKTLNWTPLSGYGDLTHCPHIMDTENNFLIL